MNPDFSLSEDDIKISLESALDQFYSGIKSKETKRTMDGNLKYFLEIICKNILQGNYKQRAQQFVDIVKDDQTKASGIVIAYVKELEKRTRLDKTDPH